MESPFKLGIFLRISYMSELDWLALLDPGSRNGVKPRTPARSTQSLVALSAIYVQSSNPMSLKDKWICTNQRKAQ
jgi:hypothetical protein